MDCFAGEIIAVEMDNNMKKELCIRARKEAYELRKPTDGLIHHSDAGSKYTSEAYKLELARRHAIQSTRNSVFESLLAITHLLN